MDPNHRQFLMSSYETLEMAGYSDGQTRTNDTNSISTFFAQATDDWHKQSHPSLGCIVRATLPAPVQIMHTIEANSSNRTSLSRSLLAAYMNGVNINWLALPKSYQSNLDLLTLPAYAWDRMDYWITWTKKGIEPVSQKSQAALPEPYIATRAPYLGEPSFAIQDF